jgi:hypothetical protein
MNGYKTNLIILALLSIGSIFWVTACGPTPSTPAASSTANPTATSSVTPLPAGSIAFIGMARNASNQIGFVANTAIAAGVTIYFTNLAWDSTHGQFSDQSQAANVVAGPLPSGPITEVEEVIRYVVGNSGLAANSAVIIGRSEPSTIADNLQGGMVINVALFANSSPSGIALTTSASELGSPVTNASALNFLNGQYANGCHLFAYTVPAGTVPSASNQYFPSGSVFTAGLVFGPDAFTAGSPANYYDSALPPGLTTGTSAVDLSGLYANMATVIPTPWATAVNGSGTSGNNISAMVGVNCPTGAAAINTNTNWVGTILGHTHLTLYSQGDANSGVTFCGAGTGFGFTTPTVTPIPY